MGFDQLQREVDAKEGKIKIVPAEKMQIQQSEMGQLQGLPYSSDFDSDEDEEDDEEE